MRPPVRDMVHRSSNPCRGDQWSPASFGGKLLAALEGDTEARQKYSQIVVANGENALDLKQTIERQLAAQAQHPD